MQYLESYKIKFDQFLKDNAFSFDPKNLYEPIDYILSLGGKRIRPLLLLMTADLVGNQIKKALPAAMAVELFHNFTLLHDDIMDDAPLRRGKSSVHEKYDVNTAILSGDVMLILSYQYLSKTNIRDLSILYRKFNKMAREVCEGQQMDMDFENRHDVSIAEYIEMIRLKTSVLIGTTLEMGAIISEADERVSKHLYGFGENIGIAFQIQDDLLDTFGTPLVGKQKCGDIIQNKKTYLYLKALDLASKDEKNTLLRLFSTAPEDPTEKIETVLNIYKSTNVKGYAEELKLVYQDLANSHLTAACLENSVFENFNSFGNYLLARKS